MTFNNFKRVKGAGKALELFSQMPDADWFMLLCYGSAGCGKTHLCEALAYELRQEMKFTRVLEWSERIRILKGAMQRRDRPGYYDQLFEGMQRAERLIIDDVGAGTTGSSWEWGELEDIVSYRYKRELFTVITTNLDVADLPDRIVSRFRDKTKARICFNSAGDYRPFK